MIPLQFALRRRMMMTGGDKQTWIYHDGSLLLPYTQFKNDARDYLVIATTPNFKIQREGYYDVTGLYFRVQINEKFVYNCIQAATEPSYIEVSSSLNTTELTGNKISKGENTITVKKPGLYYITFKFEDYYNPVIFSELFVV